MKKLLLSQKENSYYIEKKINRLKEKLDKMRIETHPSIAHKKQYDSYLRELRKWQDKGNEIIEELVKKVNTVDSIDDKLSACVMIISHLEMKNSVRPGSYTHRIGISKKHPPKSPEEIEKLNQLDQRLGKFLGSDINTFLFYLKKIDENCYLELVEKIRKKEGDKERLGTFGVIVGFILVFYFLFKIVNS